VNGTATEEGKFDKQEYYYFNVSAPGFISNNSNNFWNSDNYGQIEDTYYIFPVPVLPPTIAVSLTWTNARDFDFSVVASDYDMFYRNADRMAAPGGETYTMSALHGSEQLIAYAYFFSNDVSFTSANPTVTFTANDVVYNTVAFNDSTSTVLTGARYWVAACFDARQNVQVLNRVQSYAPTVYDCTL